MDWQTPVIFDTTNNWILYRGQSYKFCSSEGVLSMKKEFLEAVGTQGTCH